MSNGPRIERSQRLLSDLFGFLPWPVTAKATVEKHLAAERKATVERIERAIRIAADAERYDLGYVKEVRRLAKDVAAILDAEAER